MKAKCVNKDLYRPIIYRPIIYIDLLYIDLLYIFNQCYHSGMNQYSLFFIKHCFFLLRRTMYSFMGQLLQSCHEESHVNSE